MRLFCNSPTRFSRRESIEVRVGGVVIGGTNPIAAQTMTNTDTNDTAACVDQIVRIRAAGGRIIRLTAQGRREAENLKNIRDELSRRGVTDVALVADIHFAPEAALVAAEYVDKVRINPGNYRDADGTLFRELIAKCRRRGVAIRIGVNHGSLSPQIVDRHGDTPEGMVASAMEFLRVCREEDFDQVVVSMKSSNVRVMVYAYRLLVEAMDAEQMKYPLHLGVTEAGNDMEGRVKSAVGIGALLADGIGDTIRVSLTEDPEHEIPVALKLIAHFDGRENHSPIAPIADISGYSPTSFRPRMEGFAPLLPGEEGADKLTVLETDNLNTPAWWRAEILNMAEPHPVMLRKKYMETDPKTLHIKAAADFGPLFIDGLAEGIDIECDGVSPEEIERLSLAILQAARVRISATEYIACPGCGRTLFDLQTTLRQIKQHTSHLKGLKIAVMGCIVNGPGEMADADFGYVGAGRGLVTLYKGREIMRRDIPQDQAIEALLDLIRSSGR